jgi:hypothetical protein
VDGGHFSGGGLSPLEYLALAFLWRLRWLKGWDLVASLPPSRPVASLAQKWHQEGFEVWFSEGLIE